MRSSKASEDNNGIKVRIQLGWPEVVGCNAKPSDRLPENAPPLLAITIFHKVWKSKKRRFLMIHSRPGKMTINLHCNYALCEHGKTDSVDFSRSSSSALFGTVWHDSRITIRNPHCKEFKFMAAERVHSRKTITPRVAEQVTDDCQGHYSQIGTKWWRHSSFLRQLGEPLRRGSDFNRPKLRYWR